MTTRDGERDNNLTAYHIQKILDNLLLCCLKPIFLNTELGKLQVINVLSWTIRNKRGKISSVPLDKQHSKLFNALLTNDKHKTLSIYMDTLIDRYVGITLVSNFLDKTEGYSYLYNLFMANGTEELDIRLQAIEESVSAERDTLYMTIQNVKGFYGFLTRFKSTIVSNYIGLCYKTANGIVEKNLERNVRMVVDKNDLEQDLVKEVIKAIDKFDYRKGALTSYIKHWLRHAEQSKQSKHKYGLAFDTPNTKNYSTYSYSVSLTDVSEYISCKEDAFKKIEEEQEEEIILAISQVADPVGVMRLNLGISEYLSKEHLLIMKRQMAEELE
jgi:hypothetical protein